MFGVGSLIFALLFSLCLGHGAVINPAFRANPNVNGGWCQWCQGDQVNSCDKTYCDPPSPCYKAPGPKTAAASAFSGYTGLKDASGQYWIDQTGGNDTVPVYCPGQTVHFSVLNYADHNGIYQFQTMPGGPGQEKEGSFKAISEWKSINMDQETTYYDIDGVTTLKPGICKGGIAWSPSVGHCRDFSLFKSSFTVPSNLPTGPTILRWIWYGAMTVDGKKVVGPEPSLFVNCKDVVIGSSGQCGRDVE